MQKCGNGSRNRDTKRIGRASYIRIDVAGQGSRWAPPLGPGKTSMAIIRQWLATPYATAIPRECVCVCVWVS